MVSSSLLKVQVKLLRSRGWMCYVSYFSVMSESDGFRESSPTQSINFHIVIHSFLALMVRINKHAVGVL